MVIYISLPITGYDEAERRAKCEEARKRLKEKYGEDTVVMSPYVVSEQIDADSRETGVEPSYGTYLGCDIMCIIDDVDMVCVLVDPDRTESKGVRLEVACARIYGKQIDVMII